MKGTLELASAVEAYKNGDQEMFSKVYELSNRYLYVCIMHIVKKDEIAQDMLQDTYIEVIKNIHQLKSSEDFLGWASTIANRKCFAYLKKQKDIILDYNGEDEGSSELDFFSNVADDEEFIPETILQNKEKQRLLKDIIDNLAEMQRLCIIAYYYNEKKQETIAEELGIPLSTVKTNLSRAKVKIKEAVIELEEKKGTRIYSLAPFMALFFATEVEACEHVPMRAALTEAASASSTLSTGGNAVKKGFPSLKAKVAVGITAGALVIAGILTSVIPSQEEAIPVSEETKQESVSVQKNEVLQEETVEKENIAETIKAEQAILLSKYEDWYVAFGGVILVKSEGLWGAVDYQEKELVPCSYTGVYHAPTSKGYFVLQNETEAGVINYLFDRDGNVVYETDMSIVPTESGYAIDSTVFASGMPGEVSYYKYDGTHILTSQIMESTAVWNLSSYKGKTTLYQFVTDAGRSTEQIGFMAEDGTVTWETPVFDSAEGIDNFAPRRAPVSAANNGYCIARSSVIEGGGMTLYTEDGKKICDWDLYTTSLQDGQLVTTMEYNDYNDYRGYWQDGYWLYNYGSKMVWTIGEKDILVDLSLATDMRWDHVDNKVNMAVYDGIYMSDETYWLVKSGQQFGYIDQEGNEVKMYDDASAFVDGKALVITDGIASLIDENFEVIQEIGAADSVSACGDLFTVTSGEETYLYIIKE